MLLLSGGWIYDGSGGEPWQGDLLIDGGRIARLGKFAAPACPVVDCAGLAVAPGFIDLHSHSDLQALESRHGEKLRQGVTAEVVGNCGFSAFPQGSHAQELCEFGGGILGRPAGWGWATAREYLDAVQRSDGKVRALPLAGHGSLRVAVAGLRQGPLEEAEMDRLAGLAEASLDAGCAGLSTGLMYAPGSSAGHGELLRLCRLVASRGKLYTTHMRSYAEGLLVALREQIDLARESGCRLQISHLQAAGRANWSLLGRALEEIEQARAEGIDVEFDIYPYQCGSTVLTQWLPAWALDGGTGELLKRLRDAGARRRIAEATEAGRAQEWSDITVSGVASAANAVLVGRTVAEVAEARGVSGVEAALDLIAEESAAVNVISFNQSEENLRRLLTHPLCSVISDGFYVNGKPHPRLHGTFPELLGTVVRERGWMTLEEAVHKITGKPAARLGLRGRGLLREGFAADVTVFDASGVRSRATYETPELPPVGIRLVIRDGEITMRGMQ
ncbi:MAG: amidohydrolase family protein [Acidobacteria bacterium]|nr:amidohydrolase family protein [Acidobacteriota bacterium]